MRSRAAVWLSAILAAGALHADTARADVAARPRNVKVGEIPRRIVALRMVRASSPAATHAAP